MRNNKDLPCTEKVQQNRIDWIDAYKGIAMMLILVHHVTQYFPLLSIITRFVTSFHVSMFFLISGWTIALKRKKGVVIREQIRKKAVHLLIPYFLFSLLSAGIKIGVLILFGECSLDSVLKELCEILTLGNGPVWFLKAMFFVSILFLCIEKYILQNEIYVKEKDFAGGGAVGNIVVVNSFYGIFKFTSNVFFAC